MLLRSALPQLLMLHDQFYFLPPLSHIQQLFLILLLFLVLLFFQGQDCTFFLLCLILYPYILLLSSLEQGQPIGCEILYRPQILLLVLDRQKVLLEVVHLIFSQGLCLTVRLIFPQDLCLFVDPEIVGLDH